MDNGGPSAARRRIDHQAASDLDLIAAARANDGGAVAELFARHHGAALKVARRLADPVTADDVVADGFARVLDAIRAGKGPTVAFRPYLLTAVRNAHVDYVRREGRYVWIADHVESGLEPTEDDMVEQLQDSQLLADAFSSLPERWQVVLWHSTVDGEDQETIGRLLGIKANAVAALRFRAREGLRLAYLSAHLAASAPDECEPVRDLLPAYVRARLPRKKRDLVAEHLETCRACSAALAEVGEISSKMGVLLLPALMGSPAGGQVATSGVSARLQEMRRAALQAGSPTSVLRAVTAAAAAMVAVAATVGVAIALDGADHEPVTGSGSEATRAGAASDRASAPARLPSPHRSGRAGGRPVRSPAPAAEVVPRSPVDLPGISPAVVDSTPTVEVSPTVRPVAGPTASTVPTASPVADPTASTVPTASPVADPTASTAPTASPTTSEDLRLAVGSVVRYPGHHHVELSVATPLAPTYVTFEVPGLVSATAHQEPQFVQAACATPTDPAEGGSTVVCELPAGSGVLAIDVVVSGDLFGSARIWAADNTDPQPANDTVVFGTP